MHKITGGQIRAGRAYAKISSKELANLASLGTVTIVKAEKYDGVPPINPPNLNAIKLALEAAGVVFHEDGCVNFVPK